jgi:hypothetical protein
MNEHKSDSKKNGFTRNDHDLQDTAAWQFVMRSGSVVLLMAIWRRHNGRNNGKLFYSVRDAQHYFGCSPKRAVKWFRELQDVGFIVAMQRGSFNQKVGADRATRWRLTMERCNGKEPTRDYLKFQAPQS